MNFYFLQFSVKTLLAQHNFNVLYNLDDSTKHVLFRGFRLIELLKQNKASPLAVNKQVLLIFAGMKGYLDKIVVDLVSSFKALLLKLVRYTTLLNDFNVSEKINQEKLNLFFKKVIGLL